MKKNYNFLFLFFFLIFSGILSAQTVSNAQVEYSCPCRVTATYTLTGGDADVVLYYSLTPDPGATWLPADTFQGVSGITNTGIWDCEAAGVLYGLFYFKLELLSSSCCEPTTVPISMIPIAGGIFTLGAATQSSATPTVTANPAVTPTSSVTLSNFCMSETQVTQAQFFAVMETNPSTYSSGVDAPNRPVEMVNWYHAIAFCNKLSLQESKTLVYDVSGIDWTTLTFAAIPTASNATWNAATMNISANGYRLPTEAEWEYAARGGNQSITAVTGVANSDFYYSGSNIIENVGWYTGNNTSNAFGFPTGTKPVGRLDHNALGLYDMSGNVWEWCWDWYAGYTSSPKIDPIGPSSGSLRVVRGGDWSNAATILRVSYRGSDYPEFRNVIIGFRLACSSL